MKKKVSKLKKKKRKQLFMPNDSLLSLGPFHACCDLLVSDVQSTEKFRKKNPLVI